MKFILKVLIAIFFLSLGLSSFADTLLPKPQMTGGNGIFDVLKARQSASLNQFSQKEPSLQELSNLLWAATGLNRQDKGWTTPYGMGLEPYVNIYVASDQGVSLYDWKSHALKNISSKNIKSMIGLQPQVAKTPMVLIFVGNLNHFNDIQEARKKSALLWPYIACGAITQNIYLAAASMNIETRFIISVNQSAVKKELNLGQNEIPINIMPIGKK